MAKTKSSRQPNASRKAPAKSAGKPVVVLLIGILAAGGLAVFLTQGGPEESAVAAAGSLDAPATHVRGPESAKVTLTEFGDFQCPTCGTFHPIVKALIERFPDDLRVEFHHMPLVSIHPNAMPSALAAEAAAVQGRFWEMSDLLFENQQAWSPMGNANEAFMVYAGALGLDTAQFERDMRSEAVRDSVIADVALSNQLRLAGTPSFFLNDQPIPLPSSYADFERTIYDAIQSAE